LFWAINIALACPMFCAPAKKNWSILVDEVKASIVTASYLLT
jgi:hypothetical protein